MKKIIILLSILLWAVLGIAQQSSWVPQVSGTTEDIYDIEMANQDTGYYVTSSLIFRTLDGGLNWTQIGSGNNFEEIFVIDAEHVYFCGEHIKYTSDAGNNISNQVNPYVNGYSITFGSSTHGWVSYGGGYIKATTDGSTWSSQTSGTSENLYDIHAVDANNVWACGENGTIIHTNDGGANWTTQTTLTITEGLYAIYFVDQNNGYAVGDNGVFFKTTDGGSTWNNTVPVSFDLADVFFLSISEGYISGSDGTLLETTDGGSTWNIQNVSQTGKVRSIYFLNTQVGWSAGSNGIIEFTDHGGDMCTTHADFTVNESCPGTISMTNASTGNFLTGGPDYAWSWEGTQWSTDVDPSYGPVAAGTYDILLEVTDGNCVDDTTVTWTVNQIDTTVVTDEFCEASVYDFFGTPLTAPGTYYHTETSVVTGCDSVVQLDLTMNMIDTTVIVDEFCEASVYDFYGTDLTAPGTYYHTLTSSLTTCDSVIQLNLDMNLIDTVVIAEEFCQGSTFTWNGSDYTTPGTYYYTTNSLVTGCDSVVQLDLVENPTYYIQETQEICDGDVYSWQGSDYTTAGTYTETYSTVVTGCDSIYELELIVHPAYEFITDESVCAGDSIQWRGNWYSDEDTYTESHTSSTGCDSTYVLNLTVNPLPDLVTILYSPSNFILPTGTSGEISLSTSYVGTTYWTTKGAAMFSGDIPGTGSALSLGTNYMSGSYDIWSETDQGCTRKQGSVVFVEDNGTTKIVGTPTYGNLFNSFVDGANKMTLYFSTTDIYGDPVILLEDGPTTTSEGNVEFDGLGDGDYYLKSELIDTATYPTVVPIFFWDGPTVDSADIISVVSGDIMSVNVNHPEYPDTTGSNTAGGSVDTLGNNTKSGGIADQIVILRNEVTGEILSVAVTDNNGNYYISKVPDYSDLELYVTSFEYQNWTPAGISTATETHYTVNFVVDGNSVYPEGTGIGDVVNNLEFSIYPNPAQDFIYLENVPDGSILKVFDLQGKLLIHDVRDIKNNLDISNLSTGTYIVVITNDGAVGTQKIIKQ